jgi:hypothetical protein
MLWAKHHDVNPKASSRMALFLAALALVPQSVLLLPNWLM